MAEEQKKPVDLVMKRPDDSEIEVAAELVEDCKAKGFVEVCTVEEARKKAAAAKKPAEK